ncbi:hydrocephalus-inducing protein homolog [Anabrus simplex]|uniref:hydrocephalus-inducing protein homolog n=1 Tax=Anabrus simplex TaxID=316456 RepID=UPI0035A3ADDF
MNFSPTSRMKQFSEQVNMVVNGKYYPLCLVKGSSIGPEFSFDRNYLPFGAVIENCSSILKLLLRNTGDIGSKFTWCDGEWTENFRITPMNGYCSPDTIVTFTVEFSPKKQQHIRNVAECNLENFTKLSLILSGSCEPLPPPTDTLIFKIPVREQDKKTIMLTNRNSINWELFPVFSGDYFSGDETVSVPSQNTKPYDVVYSPLRMTDEKKHTGRIMMFAWLAFRLEIVAPRFIPYDDMGQKRILFLCRLSVNLLSLHQLMRKALRVNFAETHVIFDNGMHGAMANADVNSNFFLCDLSVFPDKDINLPYHIRSHASMDLSWGSIFFQLPEGQGLLYQLIGTAEPPLISARISHEVPAKSTHTVQIPVTNWLHVPQRFCVDIELIRTEKYDPVIKLDANNYIDVLGNSEKDFSLSFSALRECTVTFKVQFLNEKTEEYQFFEVTFRVVKGNILDVIRLTSFARHPTAHQIKIENPLPVPVNFTVNCTSPDVQCLSTLTIPAKAEVSWLEMFFGYHFTALSQPSSFPWAWDWQQQLLGYSIHPEVTAGGIDYLSILLLCTQVSTIQILTVNNRSNCNCACFLLFQKSVLFEYLPLQAGESSARLELISNDLGNYPYDLILTALPAPTEKPLRFTAPLGGSSVTETYVSNLTKGKVDFHCKVDNPDFRVEKVVSGAASHKATVEVIFEPSSLGNSQGTLFVTSVAGDFVFPLYGVCTQPKPQGPLIIRPGTPLVIHFKNIFSEVKTFSMYVDQPLFTLKNSSETVKARKEFRITITMPSMKSLERLDPKYPVTGKLVVASADPNIKWIYYIKGVLDQ